MRTWTLSPATLLLTLMASLLLASGLILLVASPTLAMTEATLCHKPGTPAEHTITVNHHAVIQAHLRHGDYLGPCIVTDTPTEVPSSTPTDTPTESPSDVPSDTPTTTPTGSIDVPIETRKPPHEHITNPPTDTVATVTDQEVDSPSLLLAIAVLLLITALLSTRTARKETN